MEDREFAVILEKIYSEIRILSEDHRSLKEKVNSIFEMAGKNREDIETIKPAIKQILTELRLIRDELKAKVGHKEFEERVASLEEKMALLD